MKSNFRIRSWRDLGEDGQPTDEVKPTYRLGFEAAKHTAHNLMDRGRIVALDQWRDGE